MYRPLLVRLNYKLFSDIELSGLLFCLRRRATRRTLIVSSIVCAQWVNDSGAVGRHGYPRCESVLCTYTIVLSPLILSALKNIFSRRFPHSPHPSLRNYVLYDDYNWKVTRESRGVQKFLLFFGGYSELMLVRNLTIKMENSCPVYCDEFCMMMVKSRLCSDYI